MHDDADAPEHAAALFESVAPALPPPAALLLEPLRTAGVVTWTIRVEGGAYYRLKAAGDAQAAALLRRGATLLGPLTSRGVPVPTSVALRELLPIHGGSAGPGMAWTEQVGDEFPDGGPSVPAEAAESDPEAPHSSRRAPLRRGIDADMVVGVETRLGTSDGLALWQILGNPLRAAVAEEAAHGLWLLHRIPLAELAPWGGLARTRSRAWREVVVGRFSRLLDRLRDGRVLSPELLAQIELRLFAAAQRLPDDLDRRVCHGAFGVDRLAVQRRVYAGMRDFESAAPGDPWSDVACFVHTVGDASPNVTDRFVRAYTGHVPAPADLTTRIDLYAGIHLLRAVRETVDRLGEEVIPPLAEIVAGWADRPARVWR